MNSKLLLIVPAYNEESSIVPVIDGIIRNCPGYDYIVVNDGSADGTRKLCREHGYRFIDLPVNLGLTAAFRAGLLYAISNGYDYALQYDADGQHDCRFIQSIVGTAERESSDITIGSRYVAPGMHAPVRGNGFGAKGVARRILTLCILLRTGKRICDPTSGMRLYNRHAMNMIYRTKELGPEPDTLCYLMKNGLSVAESYVEMHERKGGKSYLTLANSIRYMLQMCFSILVVSFIWKRGA